jgi:hypothetical protein
MVDRIITLQRSLVHHSPNWWTYYGYISERILQVWVRFPYLRWETFLIYPGSVQSCECWKTEEFLKLQPEMQQMTKTGERWSREWLESLLFTLKREEGGREPRNVFSYRSWKLPSFNINKETGASVAQYHGNEHRHWMAFQTDECFLPSPFTEISAAHASAWPWAKPPSKPTGFLA